MLLAELKLLIQEACKNAQFLFVIEDGERDHGLNWVTNREMLQWIADHWEKYHELFTQMAVNHRSSFPPINVGQRATRQANFADD
jgi:hypothetical protein